MQVLLFGDPGILDRHGNRIGGLRRAALEVLLYLALHREGVHLDVLRELIWADTSLSKANKRMSTEIANLRRTVRIALGDPENLSVNAVVNSGSHYALAGFLDVDVHAFEDALRVAELEPDGSPGREKALRRAVGLHTGRLGDRPTLDCPWLAPHRRRLLRAGAKARVALAESIHPREPQQARSLLHEAAALGGSDQAIHQYVTQALSHLSA